MISFVSSLGSSEAVDDLESMLLWRHQVLALLFSFFVLLASVF
jgi:hypothetical protein